MADRDNKFEDNVEGQYYVDEECIDCNLCREIAPSNFKANVVLSNFKREFGGK